MTRHLKVLCAAAALFISAASLAEKLPTETKSAADRVADWQLAHMQDLAYIRTFREETEQRESWIQAAFYIGLTRWAETTNNDYYRAALLAKAEADKWKLAPRHWHADDHAMAQVYLHLAKREPGARLDDVIEKFDRLLAEAPDNSLDFRALDEEGESEGNCQRRMCWCDALFMSPPSMAMLSNATGDVKYRDYALREYFAVRDYLYDADEHLFYRDSRFFDQRTPHGNKVFWSRGNGWVFAGLPLLLEALPDGHPGRARLEALFLEMAQKFRSIQHPGGYWASSLLDFEHDPLPETSGTGFITFGLAWGVNQGLLPADEYRDAIKRGWTALVDAVDDDGKLGWVQQVGNAPDQVLATDTQLYGVGAMLLAASEVVQINPPISARHAHFNPARDLLLAQFDSKTDVDDLHSVAGVATILRSPAMNGVRFHAVAGAYGTQEGLYVPAPELFDLAFGEHWSDAHGDWQRALHEVVDIVSDTLESGGDVWVAEAGQSDFTADWLRRIAEKDVDTRSRIHVVQHSEWNQEVTSPEKLRYAREHSDYHKIADGNAAGNGTPIFRDASAELWEEALAHVPMAETWRTARSIADRYNGVEDRYLNDAIADGGMDFSDVVETCWIVGCADLADAGAFFARFHRVPLLQNPHARTLTSLDGEWHAIVDPYENGFYNHRYQEHPNGYFRNYEPQSASELVEYSFRNSETLQVPGDWNSQRESLFFYEGTIWYQKDFELAKRDDRRYHLHFDAVNYTAVVYVNGSKVGQHEGGFTPFRFEVTDFVQDGANFVVVKADNRREPDNVPTMNTDWWNFGGITRSVALLETPRTYVEDYVIGLANGKGAIAGFVQLGGDRPAADATAHIEIPALQVEATVPIDASMHGTFEVVANPALWSPDAPVIYDVTVRYGEESISDRIGFRRVAVAGGDILLNNKPVFLRGISLHEEAPQGGSRANSKADAWQLLAWVKQLGANFVRLAHYPHNEHMLRAADELGLLVWSEIPVYWTVDFESDAVYRKAEAQLDDMIVRDRNRASVILWSVANETPGSDARFAFLSGLADRVRELDDSRLVTAALDTHVYEGDVITIADPLADVVDVIGINTYCGWYSKRPEECATQQWQSQYEKPVVISEFGAGALQGLHGEEEQRWTEEYQASVYRNNLEMIRNMPFVRGMSPWILKDFRSPRRPLPGIQDFWNRKGLLSEDGQRKQAWYILRDFYTGESSAATP